MAGIPEQVRLALTGHSRKGLDIQLSVYFNENSDEFRTTLFHAEQQVCDALLKKLPAETNHSSIVVPNVG